MLSLPCSQSLGCGLGLSACLRVPPRDSCGAVQSAVPCGRLLWVEGVPRPPLAPVSLTSSPPWSLGARSAPSTALDGGLCPIPKSPASVRWGQGGWRSRELYLLHPYSCVYSLRREHRHGALPGAMCHPGSRPLGLMVWRRTTHTCGGASPEPSAREKGDLPRLAGGFQGRPPVKWVTLTLRPGA